MILLFKVEDTFQITGHGLILTPSVPPDIDVSTGDQVLLKRPDTSEIKTTIKGIAFSRPRDILVDKNISKKDLPIGTEVWLIK